MPQQISPPNNVNYTINQHLQQVVRGLYDSTSIVESERLEAEVRDRLRPYEDENPVSIVEFIESDTYLNLGKFVFPAGKWIADTFYNPQDHYDECRYTWTNKKGINQEFIFPGFSSLDYTKEQVANFQFNELVIIIGQRAIKSVISAIISLYEFYRLLCLDDVSNHYDGIAPKTPIYVSLGATAAAQSDETVFSYVENWFEHSPWFSRYRGKASELKLPDGQPLFAQTSGSIGFRHKNIFLNAVHSKSGSLRGYTRKAIVNDEISHFDEGQKRSADATYDAMSNSTETFGEDGLKVSISSPLHVTDKGMRLLSSCAVKFRSTFYDQYGFSDITEFNGQPIEQSAKMLGFHYPTWEINPVRTFESFQTRLRVNPESTLRDFGALPSQAEVSFFSDGDAIAEVFDPRTPCPINEVGQVSSSFRGKGGVHNYYLHVDVGIGKPSNFGIGLAHTEIMTDSISGEKRTVVVVDLAYAVTAKVDGEVDLSKARELLDVIIERFPIASYTSDRWQDVEYHQRIKSRVRSVDRLIVGIEHYEELKTLIYNRQVRCHSSNLGKACKVSPEEELKRLGLVNGRKVEKGVGYTKDISDCYDDQTYVMTDNGWKLFKDVEPTEKLMTRTPDGVVEYHVPDLLIAKPYSGDMYTYDGRFINFSVTPTHNMLFKADYGGGDPSLQPISSIKSRGVIPRTAVVDGGLPGNFPVQLCSPIDVVAVPTSRGYWAETEDKVLTDLYATASMPDIMGNLGRNRASIYNRARYLNLYRGQISDRIKDRPDALPTCSLKDFASFVGFWLAEGRKDFRGFGVKVTQTNLEGIAWVDSLFDRLGWPHQRMAGSKETTWIVKSWELREYLGELVTGDELHIPKEAFMEWGVEAQEALLEGLCVGDGIHARGRVAGYCSTSLTLVEDVQRLLAHVGLVGNIRLVRPGGEPVEVMGTVCQNPKNLWQVSIFKNKNAVYNPKHIHLTQYEGLVYCATVKNHTLYVRRKGKPMWCGNCMAATCYVAMHRTTRKLAVGRATMGLLSRGGI